MQQNSLIQKFASQFSLIESASTGINVLQLANNASTMFYAASAVAAIREALTNDVMNAVIMPLCNTKAGFLTDRKPTRKNPNPIPYTLDEVRSCVIEALTKGVLATGNHFNIIAGSCYITREGYAYLLKKLGCKFVLEVAEPVTNGNSQKFSVKINAEYRGERIAYTANFTLPKGAYTTDEQNAGKAWARAVKSLYTYVTGIDMGDASELQPDEPRTVVDTVAEDVTVQFKPAGQAAVPQPEQVTAAAPKPQQMEEKAANQRPEDIFN